MKRTLVYFLIFTLTMSVAPAFAESQFRKSMTDAAVADAQARSRRARAENPYKMPGLVLLSAGAALTLFGFIFPSGVECTDRGGAFSLDVQCGTKANKGLLFTGIGAAGVGTFLMMKGSRDSSASPSVSPLVGGFVVRKSVGF